MSIRVMFSEKWYISAHIFVEGQKSACILMHRHLYNMNVMLQIIITRNTLYEYVVYWIWVGIKYMYTTRSFKILKILFTDTFSINNYKYLCCSM